MAMLPFCGYNMGDYFAHWLKIGETAGAKLPKIYYVNWFQQDEHGRFLWPGYGENSRVLKWIFERCDGRAGARETAIGRMPHPADIDLGGLDLPPTTSPVSSTSTSTPGSTKSHPSASTSTASATASPPPSKRSSRV